MVGPLRRLLLRLSFVPQRLVWLAEDCCDLTLRACGPLYVLVALALIGGVVTTVVSTVIPLLVLSGTPSPFAAMACHAAVSLWIVCNILFNYLLTIRTDPGSVPADFAHPADVEGNAKNNAVVASAPAPAGAAPTQPPKAPPLCVPIPQAHGRWCDVCNRPKPALTQHCYVCRRCVVRQDHHCPWVAGCVGHHNYRYFFLFVFWLWVGCAYASAATVVAQRLPGGDAARTRQMELALTLAFSVFCALSMLLFWHVYLVLTAQTTVEFHRQLAKRRERLRRGERYVNPLDQGCVSNFKRALVPARLHGEGFAFGGRYWWLAWMLPLARPPVGDGLLYF